MDFLLMEGAILLVMVSFKAKGQKNPSKDGGTVDGRVTDATIVASRPDFDYFMLENDERKCRWVWV